MSTGDYILAAVIGFFFGWGVNEFFMIVRNRMMK